MGIGRSIPAFLVALMAFSLAPAATVAQGSKFATVDMARVLREYDEVKRVAAQLQARKDEYQEEIDKKQQEIKSLNDKIQNSKDADEKAKFEKSKRSKLSSLQQQFSQLKEKLAELEKEMFDQIKNQIYAEIDKLAAAKGVAMIIEKQWLYYPRRTEDLTDELLKSLEAKGGSTGESKPRKKAPPTPAPEKSDEE
jgi:Skp family chaperone for outer membrane proteins